jgi:hypothetical protein
MIKKNRKSLFTWCIRTLAVSLVPTLLLVSCAADDDSSSTTADTTAPTVMSTIPLLNATGVNKATAITVTFSEPVDVATVTTTDNTVCAGSVQLSNDSFSSCVSFESPYLVMDGNTKFIFDPASDLAYSGTYQLKLTGDIADAAGNKLSPMTIDFAVVDATMGETATMDLSTNLTTAGLSASDVQVVVAAANAQFAADNLTQSTDLGLIKSSLIAGAFTGIGSVDNATRLAAVDATVQTIMGLFGKFSSSITDPDGRTDGRSLSRTLGQLLEDMANDIKQAAAKAKVANTASVISEAGEATGKYIKLTPAATAATAATLAAVAAKYAEAIATMPGISKTEREAALASIGSRVLKGADSAGLPATTVKAVAEQASTAVITALSKDDVKKQLTEDGISSTAIIENSSSQIQTQVSKSTTLSAADKKATTTSVGGKVEEAVEQNKTALGLSDAQVNSVKSSVSSSTTAAADAIVVPATDDSSSGGSDTSSGGSDTSSGGSSGSTTPTVVVPSVELSISPTPVTVSAKTRTTGGVTLLSDTYSLVNSANPVMTVKSGLTGSYVVENCTSNADGSIVGGVNETVTLTISDKATTSNSCKVTVTATAGGVGSATLSAFQVDASGPSADLYLQSYFATDVGVVTNAKGSGTNDNTSTVNLNARISNMVDTNGVGVKGYFLSESSSIPTTTSSDWVLATELTNGQITNADNITRLLDSSDDNVTFTLSTTGATGATRTVYLHLLDFAGNTASVSDTIFLMADTEAPSNFDNFKIRDVGTTVDNASITNSNTVTLSLDAYDNKTGIAYVYASEDNTNASAIVQSLLDNKTVRDNTTAVSGTSLDNFSTYFKAVIVGSTSDNLSTYSYTFDNNTSGTKTVYTWVADGGRNIYSADNKSDSIYLDSVVPTIDNATVDGNATGDNQTAAYGDNVTNATSGDVAYTDNRTVTITLGYTDNQSAVFQYYISENGTTGSTSQYVDNVSGVVSADFTGKNAPFVNTDNFSLTHAVWSELDNDTTDSANNSVFRVTDNGSDNGTSDNISYTFSSDGAKTLTISIKDAANNITTTTRSITVDSTPPARKAGANLSFVDNASKSSPTTITVTNSLTLQVDSLVSQSLFEDLGIAANVNSLHAYYLTDDNTTPTSSASFTHSPFADLSFTVDEDSTGSATITSGDNLSLYIYALDKLGNGDNATGEGYSIVTANILFDNDTAVASDNISVSSTNTQISSDNQTFYTRDTAVSFDNASVLNTKMTDNDTALSFLATTNTSYTADNISSLGSFAASLSNISLTANDNNTINVFAKDHAGNIALVDNITVISDTTIPVMDNITLTGNIQGGADNTTHTDNATLKIAINGGADNQTTTNSGLAYYYATDNASKTISEIRAGKVTYANPGTVTLTSSTPGVKTVYVYLMDNALNVSDNKSDTITFVGDSTVPTVSSVKINNRAPALDNATYTNSDNVTVEIVAQDNQSSVVYWSINEDNSTPSSWTAFATPGNNVSENVTFVFSNSTDGVKQVYAFVKNSQDNVSVMGSKSVQGFDNITLDDTAPVDNGTQKLTGKIDLVDNHTYTDNLTVTLDNLTNWFSFTTTDNGTYLLTDNSSFTPTYSSSGWQILDNLTFTIGNYTTGSSWNGSGQTLGNTSLGLKTIHVWAKDNASNVSASASSVSITFDNESPVLTSFTLRDLDNSSSTAAFNYSLTNGDNVSIQLDNISAADNGTGIVAYFFTDNATLTPGPDNVSWITDNSSMHYKFDNTTNTTNKIVYGYVKDAAGQVSSGAQANITFDNASPVIDNLTWRPDRKYSTHSTTPASGNVTLYISANDNESAVTNNSSSNFTDFFIAYKIERSGTLISSDLSATDDNVSSASWISFTNLKDNDTVDSIEADNKTFDNASYVLDFASNNNLINSWSSSDNLTVVIWFRDNASNVSGNKTTVFDLDNATFYHKN